MCNSTYVFDSPILFACLVTSVDEELRCFLYFSLFLQLFVMTGKRCGAFNASADPQSLRRRLRVKVKQFDSSDVASVGIRWIRDGSSKEFEMCFFYYSVCCNLHI